ncbi:endo-1,4-beta-xylanase [Nocardia sp. NPDC006630]|uniref:endo-1,4-beta-xylanase n=1 Tax=Nocardia sp. NPDC006630 TaxID=3157181 RepID=UPI0033B8F78A
MIGERQGFRGCALPVLATVAMFAVTACGAEAQEQSTPSDLLAGRDWSHFAGARRESDGIHISPLGRALVEQDGTGGSPNPPVNLRGPFLEVRGDFQVASGWRQVGDHSAYLYLYGEVPVVFDEWRQQRRAVRLGLDAGSLHVAVWDGMSAEPVTERTFEVAKFGPHSVALEHRGGRLRISADGSELGELPDSGVFATGTVWFGADAAAGGPGWTLSALSAQGLDGGKVEVRDAPDLAQSPAPRESLRTLAEAIPQRPPLRIGAAVSAGPLSTDAAYRSIAAGEFSMLTTENELKPQFVHPQPGVYDFTEADTLVEFAERNGMSVHGHTLVFGEANPRWMTHTPAQDRRRVMEDHIATVAGHYRGRVAEWDVVNEPLSVEDSDYADGKPGLRQHLWMQAMGESYIGHAFRAARAADPAAELYLNEFGIEADGRRWDALYALVKRLVADNVPIDGVGFQNHIHESGDHLDQSALRRHIQALQALGIASRISETDIHGEDSAVQADQYAESLRACRAEPSCTSFSTWGITDRYGSTADPGAYPPSPGDELLWTTDLQPKPAYAALAQALSAE